MATNKNSLFRILISVTISVSYAPPHSVENEIDNAVGGKHYRHSNNSPKDMLSAFFSFFSIIRIFNEFKNSVEKYDKSKTKEKINNGIQYKQFNVIEEL